MWNLKDNFRGTYTDLDQLKELLRGTRDYCFLETFNTKTFEFNRYEWKSYYEVKDLELDNGEKYPIDKFQQECKYILVQKWPVNGIVAERINFTYNYLENTTSSDANMKYYSGYWELM